MAVLLFNACIFDKAKEVTEDISNDVKEEVKKAKAEINGNISDLKKEANENIEEYKVVVQNLVDSSVQYISVDADGNFSVDLDSLKSVALTILDGSSSVAAIVQAASSIGFSVDDSIDLGKLEFSGEKVAKFASSHPSIYIDSQYIVNQLQASSLGYGSSQGIGSTFDRDGDGVIDLFDVDVDNNGILNDQDVEDLLLKMSQLGEAAIYAEAVDLTTSLVTEYKMPVSEQMKQASLGIVIRPLGGISIDSITVTGPEFLFTNSMEWRYMCNTCQGDNRPLITENGQPVRGKLKLAQDNGVAQWQALVGDQSDQKSIAKLRPGDVIVLTVHKGNIHIPILRSVSWVFKKTPTLAQIAKSDGSVLYTQTDLDAFATKPMEENPVVDSTSDLIFTVNMLRGITDTDTLPLKGFDNYEIQFMQEAMVGGQPQQEGMGNITNTENSQYLKYLADKHQLQVTIPVSFLKKKRPDMQITGYKIDLGMYDRSRNKTVMQIRLNLPK